MKLTSAQLRRIIKEEVANLRSLNEYGLGASASPAGIDAAKAALDALRIEIEKNLVEEGHDETDVEDMTAAALRELFDEFMEGVGYVSR